MGGKEREGCKERGEVAGREGNGREGGRFASLAWGCTPLKAVQAIALCR